MSAPPDLKALRTWVDELAALDQELASVSQPDTPLEPFFTRAETLLSTALIPTPPAASAPGLDPAAVTAEANTIVALLDSARSHQRSITSHLQRIQTLLLAHGRHDDRLRRTLGAYATPDLTPPRYINNRH